MSKEKEKEKDKKKLTSVKILPDIYIGFKRIAIETQITLQKIVNRTLYLYTNNIEYRQMIDTTIIPMISGSLSLELNYENK